MSSGQTLVDPAGRPVGFRLPRSERLGDAAVRVGRAGGSDEALWCHTDTDFLGRVNAAGVRRLHLVERGG